jgi:hypothetical protein
MHLGCWYFGDPPQTWDLYNIAAISAMDPDLYITNEKHVPVVYELDVNKYVNLYWCFPLKF